MGNLKRTVCAKPILTWLSNSHALCLIDFCFYGGISLKRVLLTNNKEVRGTEIKK